MKIGYWDVGKPFDLKILIFFLSNVTNRIPIFVLKRFKLSFTPSTKHAVANASVSTQLGAVTVQLAMPCIGRPVLGSRM